MIVDPEAEAKLREVIAEARRSCGAINDYARGLDAGGQFTARHLEEVLQEIVDSRDNQMMQAMRRVHDSMADSKPTPPEFQQIINDNFWNLLKFDELPIPPGGPETPDSGSENPAKTDQP